MNDRRSCRRWYRSHKRHLSTGATDNRRDTTGAMSNQQILEPQDEETTTTTTGRTTEDDTGATRDNQWSHCRSHKRQIHERQQILETGAMNANRYWSHTSERQILAGDTNHNRYWRLEPWRTNNGVTSNERYWSHRSEMDDRYRSCKRQIGATDTWDTNDNRWYRRLESQ